MIFKLTKEDSQEVLHKLGILCSEPELQEGYGISQIHADELLASVPRNGGKWDVDSPWALKIVRGEMLDHVEVMRDQANDALNALQTGQGLRIAKQAKRFERMFS